MASKHFPQDFFNSKIKKSITAAVNQTTTQDDTMRTSFEHDKSINNNRDDLNFNINYNDTTFSNFNNDKSINDYIMKTSLTIDYD